MNQFRKLFSTTMIYFLGNASMKLLGFLMLPLYTFYIAPEQYGLYDLYTTYSTLISALCFFEVWQGVMKFVFDAKTDMDKEALIHNGMALMAFSIVIYCLVFAVFGLFNQIEKPTMVVCFGIATALSNYWGYIARTRAYNRLYAVSGFASSACMAAVSTLLLLFTDIGYTALFIGLCAGSLTQVVMLERRLKLLRTFKLRNVSSRVCLRLLKFSVPLSLSTVGYWFFSGYNRTVIVQRLSEEANGYFAVAAKFGLVISFASMCFTRAWQEFSFSRSEKTESTSRVYSNISRKYFHFLILGFGMITIAANLAFPYVINESYAAAMYLVPIMMFASVLDAYHAFLAGIVNTYQKSHMVFISMVCGCIVNVIAVQMLIGRIGVYAGGCSMILGYSISIGIRMGIIKKIIQYQPKINWLAATLIVAVSFVNYWFGSLFTSLALLAALLGLIWLEFGPLLRQLTVRPKG